MPVPDENAREHLYQYRSPSKEGERTSASRNDVLFLEWLQWKKINFAREKKMKKIITLISILILAGFLHGVADAGSPPTNNVFVTNTSSNPVPVTGNVNIANTPDVNVVNLVKLSSERYRIVGGNPFTILDGQVSGQTGCMSLTIISHPPVIIEYFSCSAKAPAGQAVIFGIETWTNSDCSAPGPFQYYLPITPAALSSPAGNITLSASQQVRITVNENGSVRYTATRTGGTSGDVAINCFADGFENLE